ncbi:P-loop containing nucleoside triphosphate hydrolase protein [Auricularia subglabra TFB-10046 SS5]|nr:P-loop containing nucleoside triphosphate hydrolase protein [Auricularia subglabra TFB-10046 SS5]
MAAFCPNSSLWDVTDACSRAIWSAGIPAAIALFFAARPVLQAVGLGRAVTFPFKPFLTLDEAEEILYPHDATPDAPPPARSKATASGIALSALAGAEAVAWILVAAFFVPATTAWAPALIALTWVYSAARLILRPRPTPHYGLLTLWVAHFVLGVIDVGALLFMHAAHNAPLPEHLAGLARATNLTAVALVVALTVTRPLALPSRHVPVDNIGVSVSPEDYTTLWSWLTFSWVYPIIAKRTNNKLNEDDVWGMSSTLRAKTSFLKFKTVFRPTLFRRLLVAHAYDVVIHLIFVYAAVLLQYSQPMLLNRLLTAINGTATASARASAVVFALLMFAASVIKTELDLQYLWITRRIAANMRCELMSAVYEKALRRKVITSTQSSSKPAGGDENGEDEGKKEGADVGRIVNLMSNDVERLSNFSTRAYILLGAPVEIVVACLLLYQVLGWSAFAGFAMFIVVLPINYALTKWGIRIQEGQLSATDKRMSVLNELISEVKFIKFFAWEQKWIERALETRRVELSWIVQDRINSSLFGLLWFIVPSFVSVVSFSVYIWTGHRLTVPVAFAAIALFNMLQQPLNVIPHFIAQFLQVGVSARRIQSFLEEEDVTQAGSFRSSPAPGTDVVAIESASFAWNRGSSKASEKPTAKKSWFNIRLQFWKREDAIVAKTVDDEEEETPFELRDINVSFPARRLTLVTGPTASGKSALLHALLGEMTQISAEGRVVLPSGKVSYAAQSPWLQHRTIRDNILFGEPLDETRYDAVLEACALKPDLAILDDGDRTEIGVRGVSLSGGQKARVALARAVYQHTSTVLLDDPLSAVDSHTARVLLDRLFRGPLLANRTVILVTHHVELMLPSAHFVVRMLDGRIDTAGTIRELRARGALEAIKKDAEAESEAPSAAKVEGEEGKKVDDNAKTKQLVEDEARAEGRVKWRIYSTYLRASSYWTWIGILFFITLYEIFHVGELLWIKVWGEASLSTDRPPAALAHASAFVVQDVPSGLRPVHELHAHAIGATSWPTLPSADEHPMFFVGVYAAITLGTATMGMLVNIIEYIGAYRASRILFQKLLVTVVRAPFRWFDVTPTGRILNRFSRDIEVVDSSLASSLGTFIGTFASFIAGIVTISYVLPAFLVPAVAVAYIYYRLAIGYLNTGRDLRRMEAVTRSPVFQSFSELLEGIVTVRAFCAEQRFLDSLFGMIDLMNKMWWTFWMLNRYLLFRFDVIGASTVLVTALIALSTITSSGGIAGWAGLTITSAMNLTMSIYWTCRFITELEMDLNSVERVIEYLDLPQEPPAIIESQRPPAYWPSSSGAPDAPLLTVENLTIKYAPDLPAVLHGISFSLRARERVGLLGRTGSGKSTIAMSLLRFVEPSDGKIIVDGIDISTIGLQDLRSKITFIPQDAALFSGTVRDNLDPFHEYSDEECADVLARVHLVTSPASAFASARTSRAPSPTEDGSDAAADAESTATTKVDEARQSVSLSTKVSAGGTNFSQGQRQLVALARALLRRSAIIIMDEATSSIDFATDAKIQSTIREEFKSSLLLTVAHRLKTVADYDRLVVLDQGKIVEFDTPLNLIRKDGGYFRNMALKSGTFSELEAIAVAASNAARD